MPAYAVDRARPALRRLALAAACLWLSPPAAAAPARGKAVAQHPLKDPPLPPPRPESAPANPAASIEPQAMAEIPSPPPRPTDLDKPSGALATASPEALADESACHERLVKLGVRFEPIAGIADGACGAPHPLRVTALPDGVDISAPATLVCPLAEALARWTREVVLPEAARHLEARPARIAIGTSYECRNQNRQASGKLSEHAFANGVDISGFDFKGRKALAIGDHPPETPEALFQQAIRTQACSYFTTVLGPGSDAAHATHLHLDLRGRGRGFRLCQ